MLDDERTRIDEQTRSARRPHCCIFQLDIAARDVFLSTVLAMLRVNHPGEKSVTLNPIVFLAYFEGALQIVCDVIVPQGGAGQPAGLVGAAPVKLADLEDAVVAAVGVARRGVEAGLVVGDAHPGGEVAVDAQGGEAARELAALEHARARHGQQRARPVHGADHRHLRSGAGAPAPRVILRASRHAPRNLCRARIFLTVILIIDYFERR